MLPICAISRPLSGHHQPDGFMPQDPDRHSSMRWLAVAWALAGFTLLLGFAIYRLAAVAVDGLLDELQPVHWLVLVGNVLFMAYTEGYRGFQLGYSPRFAARTLLLRNGGSLVHCLLAPLFAMGLYAAPRRQLMTGWLLTALIVLLVIVFRYIPQPWRGILDAGVVVGLGWGLTVTWIQVLRLHATPEPLPN